MPQKCVVCLCCIVHDIIARSATPLRPALPKDAIIIHPNGRFLVGEWPLHNAYNRYKFVAASLPKRFRNRLTSETAT
jgi:hypothetical protein